MRTRAAVLHELHAPWSIEEIELDPPKAGEVLVKLAASGMCHSDEHLVTGDLAGATAGFFFFLMRVKRVSKKDHSNPNPRVVVLEKTF